MVMKFFFFLHCRPCYKNVELQSGGLSAAQYVEQYFSSYDDMHTSITTYVVMTSDYYSVVHESCQTSENHEVAPLPI